MADEHNPPGWTVEALRNALDGLPGNMKITVRGQSEDGDDFCGGILCAGVEHAHDEDDTAFFAIDCSNMLEDFDDETSEPIVDVILADDFDTLEDFDDAEAPPHLTLVKPS